VGGGGAKQVLLVVLQGWLYVFLEQMLQYLRLYLAVSSMYFWNKCCNTYVFILPLKTMVVCFFVRYIFGLVCERKIFCTCGPVKIGVRIGS
jgi:hypothetical protein